MSRLWSAIQAHYRPTAAYVVSVVLIEARKPSRTPLPVLARGPSIRSRATSRRVVEPSLLPPYPTIERVAPPDEQPAARLGETVRLAGHHLAGTSVDRRASRTGCSTSRTRSRSAPTTDPTGIDVTLPPAPPAEQDWPAGVYTVSVSLIRPGETDPRDDERRGDAARARAAAAAGDAITRDATTGTRHASRSTSAARCGRRRTRA